ncbi:DUF971 domain-containing protein [Tardiphaga sp. 42S5]|uniref:DUF971 domain-containing protein n=1 Tax=Tardiphaga sp. 42S5 TaxID=1404799 RepID=UPI002A59BD03|nr:gamma-butyrobetaine hydroxylase-like domain-containing protein [Tardiphaga sp. 42S5]WPO42187.1 gamma-butyrobetaine hydroxylase-like domain-containing protein [Tardiphaga sp. 42S5]
MAQSATPSALVASIGVEPTQISVSDDLSFLDLAFAEGDAIRLSAKRLRSACKCAHCLRARIEGVFPNKFDSIAIALVAPIGGYAINIAFSDGHARGIYPWAFLLDLNEAGT